jgi:GMP synthase-like glutamine amidotransferase
MKSLIIMHVESEGPGTLGSFLESEGVSLHTVRLYEGEVLPTGLRDFNAIISMGGPMNVYEDERYPFLFQEAALLVKALDAEVPILGICLGAQMIARAAGAFVTKSPKKEVGWLKVRLTDHGRHDALFQGLPSSMEVLQWHEDMFQVPDGGQLLATSEDCPNQAFRYSKAYGLQFHVEVTREILSQWFAETPQLPDILERYDQIEPELNRQAFRMYRNFLSLIRK